MARHRNGFPTRSTRCGAGSRAYVAQLTQARATQHRLAQAEQAAHVRLQRAEAVRSAYAFFGVEAKRALGDASPVDAAHKVTLAVPKVLAALERLRAERPLAHALLPAPDAEHPVDQRAWEKGRDEYLNWEAHRIIASMRAHSS